VQIDILPDQLRDAVLEIKHDFYRVFDDLDEDHADVAAAAAGLPTDSRAAAAMESWLGVARAKDQATRQKLQEVVDQLAKTADLVDACDQDNTRAFKAVGQAHGWEVSSGPLSAAHVVVDTDALREAANDLLGQSEGLGQARHGFESSTGLLASQWQGLTADAGNTSAASLAARTRAAQSATAAAAQALVRAADAFDELVDQLSRW
jgi:uncharacterized protein YukE